MASIARIRKFRRILIYTASLLLALFFLFLILVDNFVEPILRDRIHTLIIKGSDSLYTYKLEKIHANFFGGNVEVENLQINIDSNRYHLLRKRNVLPPLTMQLKLDKGEIRGISVVSLLLGKKVKIEEIMSRQADIKLSRHPRVGDQMETDVPLWKSIQPEIEGIYVKRIKLDGIKLLYRNADTSESVKLQFDRCDALFENIAVDSSSANDTSRIGFTKDIFLKFHDLKFRTQDSSYKMKAEWITYSSRNKTFEVDSFKLQPTLEKEDFYRTAARQASLYYIEFAKVRFENLHIDRYLHHNRIEADNIIFEAPDLSIYNDRTLPPDTESKVGKYPHQKLLQSDERIIVKNIQFNKGKVRYTEKNARTQQEGDLFFHNLRFDARNITNDPALIKKNPIFLANAQGNILGAGQVNVQFRFFLDSLEGQYEARGSVKNISARELNPLARALANVNLNSMNIHSLDFLVKGEDFEARSDVNMKYNNLSIALMKIDEETGARTTKGFLTRVLNKFVIWPENPGADGVERTAKGARVTRLSSQSFFGMLWKAIFAGMQDLMMKSGRYQ
ncbi:MAG TPA: hypothetical protein VGC29_06520 [Flavisolibacter sp.]